MKAIVADRYGPPAVLAVRDVEQPPLTDDGVMVRVRASSVNPAQWYAVTGRPYVFRAMGAGLLRPKRAVPGVEFAGIVEAAGRNVTQFTPGDEVFGARSGAWAEYVCAHTAVVSKPANLTFEQAAAVPTAALTALQGLRDHGGIRPGQQVLVNGASGGVGTFAVQLAKVFGAEVTGVCSTRNVDLVRSLGADHVVDYTQEDFTRSGRRYDLLLDVAGSRTWSEYKRVLAGQAVLVLVGAPKGNPWTGPLGHLARVRVAALGARQRVVFFLTKFSREDLLVLHDLLAAGKVTPVIDRQYALGEAPAALEYLGQGHARGKVVITV